MANAITRGRADCRDGQIHYRRSGHAGDPAAATQLRDDVRVVVTPGGHFHPDSDRAGVAGLPTDFIAAQSTAAPEFP